MRDWLTHLPYVTRQSWRNGNGLDFYPAGRMTVAPRLIVLHSTETTGFPGYNNGAANPHFTLDLRSGAVRQHVPLSWGSRCLAVSSGGVTDRTVNITGTIQIETIGAVTPGYPARYGHYDLVNTFPNDERAHMHLARLLRAIHDETGIPLRTSGYARWVKYPGSYGARASQRLTSAQFRDARGIVGHQHAPGNDHGDGLYGRAVGGKAVDLEDVLDLARVGIKGNRPAAPPEPEPKPDPNKGFTSEHLRRVESMLDDLGYEGGDVWAKTLAYQRDHGLTPDGLPGNEETTPHMEKTMSEVLKRLDRIEKKIDARPSVKDIATAVWQHVLYGFAAHWWVRRGSLGSSTEHRHFPADPGSPADKELRAEAVANEGRAAVYTHEGPVMVRLDEATGRFVKEAV